MKLYSNLLSLWICLLFHSCTINTFHAEKNEQIDLHEYREVKKLEQIIIKSIQNKDGKEMPMILSSALKDRSHDVEEFMNNIPFTLVGQAKPLDEFHIHSAKSQTMAYVKEDYKGYEYQFNYLPIGEQTYIDLFILQDSFNNKWLISTVFNYENEQWKLSSIDIGIFEYKLRIAPEYYNEIRGADVDLLSKVLGMQMAIKLFLPGGSNFHYQSEKEAAEYNNAILTQANRQFQLPYKLTSVTNSSVYNIETIFHRDKFYPSFLYRTSATNYSQTSISKEIEKANVELLHKFKAVSNVADTVIYRIVNDEPSRSSSVIMISVPTLSYPDTTE